eukprot:3724791-Pleurochrysis_carterae.AAC.1
MAAYSMHGVVRMRICELAREMMHVWCALARSLARTADERTCACPCARILRPPYTLNHVSVRAAHTERCATFATSGMAGHASVSCVFTGGELAAQVPRPAQRHRAERRRLRRDGAHAPASFSLATFVPRHIAQGAQHK